MRTLVVLIPLWLICATTTTALADPSATRAAHPAARSKSYHNDYQPYGSSSSSFSSKKGLSCPKFTTSDYNSNDCYSDCSSDNDCSDVGFKCCSNGCAKLCLEATIGTSSPSSSQEPSETGGGSPAPTPIPAETTTPTASTPNPPGTRLFCPGGSVTSPFGDSTAAAAAGKAPTAAAKVPLTPGLQNPFPQRPKPSSRFEANFTQSIKTRQGPIIPIFVPSCMYSCSSNSDCNVNGADSGQKCCIQGCTQQCTAGVAQTSPCALIDCGPNAQCLDFESGGVCDTVVHAGSCPVDTNFYGGSYATCKSDGDCMDNNEKCCKSSGGFVCVPVVRPMPLTCNDVFCAGNTICTTTGTVPDGTPQCVPQKPYQCPYYSNVMYGGNCTTECTIDRDCKDDGQKCCQVGCSHWCVDPDLSYSCAVIKCREGYTCKEDQYGYGSCMAPERPGMCPNSGRIPIDLLPCFFPQKPGECAVDADCPQSCQKCCRSNSFCGVSQCTFPATSCDNIFCNYDERCVVMDDLARCVKGLCAAPDGSGTCPDTKAICGVGRGGCRGDQICCPDNCKTQTCNDPAVYCPDMNCPAGDTCLQPFYPKYPDFSCYDPNNPTTTTAMPTTTTTTTGTRSNKRSTNKKPKERKSAIMQ